MRNRYKKRKERKEDAQTDRNRDKLTAIMLEKKTERKWKTKERNVWQMHKQRERGIQR